MKKFHPLCNLKWASFFISTILFSFNSRATVWPVGAGRTYTSPSTVALLVKDGDTINIDAGTYTADVAKWTKDNLVFRGVGGMAHLKANNTASGSKAIWVMEGNNATVEFIEFSGCHDVSANDKNWAGIREEGSRLTVRNCYFHDNDNGILAGTKVGSKIVIEYSEFAYNGFPDGFSHNLYIGEIDTLVFQYNYSHHAKQGHELKSRAHVNYILYNRISNEATGTASRNIDLPQGGLAIVMGNLIHQSTTTNNSNLIGYKLEAITNPAPHHLYLINNTIVSDRSTAIFVSLGAGTELYKGYNNIIAGPGSLLSGSATTLDTSNNTYLLAIADAGFVNSASYDYHLQISSPAINKGKNAGAAINLYSLTPLYEYTHPVNFTNRITSGIIDAGAYEYQNINTTLPTVSVDVTSITVAENVGTVSVPVTINNVQGTAVTVNFSLSGTATLTSDYSVSPSASVSFPANAINGSVQNIVFTIVNDKLAEPTETIKVTLTANAAAYNLANSLRIININNVIGIEAFVSDRLFHVYPNPATHYLTITNPSLLNDASWELLNTLGMKISHGALTLENTEVDISSLSPGVYFIKIGNLMNRFTKE